MPLPQTMGTTFSLFYIQCITPQIWFNHFPVTAKQMLDKGTMLWEYMLPFATQFKHLSCSIAKAGDESKI